jgi:hypothetical protein
MPPMHKCIAKGNMTGLSNPVVETSGSQILDVISQKPGENRRTQQPLKDRQETWKIHAITCTLAGIKGETSSKKLTDSSISRRHPFV